MRNVINPSPKHSTLRKNHFSGFIQRRFDYIFISNSVQESVHNINVLPYFCIDPLNVPHSNLKI